MTLGRFRSLLLMPALLIGACASPPTHFYSLGAAMPVVSGAHNPLSVAIGPIELPRYLDRPQLVSREAGSQLRVDEFNRWGGSLEQDIQRRLSVQLMDALHTERVFDYPSGLVDATDYRVALVVRRFDGRLGGKVELDVGWSLFDGHTGRLLSVQQAQFRAATDGAGYPAYVAALDQVLRDLGGDLVNALRRAQQR